MSDVQRVQQLLDDLNSSRNYIVERFVHEIPYEHPMKIIDADLKKSCCNEDTIKLVIDAKDIKFNDYAEGDLFILTIQTSYDEKIIFNRLIRLLITEGETFITLKTRKQRGFSDSIPIWNFTHQLPPIN